MKVLVIGDGGREHCLVWKISQSPLVEKIYCAPGNGGTSLLAQNVNIGTEDIYSLLNFALDRGIDLTVVGPEAPLAQGIVDVFEENGLKVFGPSAELALLEGSKIYAKQTMRKFGVPTADFEVFDNPYKAKEYVKSKGAPIVVKADGLAGGKGVIVCHVKEEAFGAVDLIMVDRIFGKAGERVVIEDCLEGEESSILIFTDGDTIVPLVSAQDHKRIFDADKGPNTGGMGAYAPAPVVTDAVFKKIMNKIFVPLMRGLKKEEKVYKGILYGGLMIKDQEPYVLEFNVRFGDPEAQVILPKLKTDLVEVMLGTVDNQLKHCHLEWDERMCLCVTLASGGYPGTYKKGFDIKGLEQTRGKEDVFVFHAGTKREVTVEGEEAKFITSGGRVLNVVGLGSTVKEVREKVYKSIENISFDGMYYRKDIGSRAEEYNARGLSPDKRTTQGTAAEVG